MDPKYLNKAIKTCHHRTPTLEEITHGCKDDTHTYGQKDDIHTYGQKRAAKRAVDKARRDMETDVYSKLDEDGGKTMIYKMSRDRDENSKDVKGGTVMKDRNGKLVIEQEAVLKVLESYFKELLNQERNNNDLELPSYVEGKVELSDITDTEMQTGMKGMKKGRAPGIDEMRV